MRLPFRRDRGDARSTDARGAAHSNAGRSQVAEPSDQELEAAPDEIGSGSPRPITHVPLVRAGIIGWSVLGLIGGLVVLAMIAQELRLVVIPLMLALFPAALLTPVATWLKRRRVPDALASVLTLLLFVAVVAGVIGILVPQVQSEIPALQESAESGVEDVQQWLEENQPFGFDAAALIEQGQELFDDFVQSGTWQSSAIEFATSAAEITTMFVLMVVVLFFYLKDGAAIARGLRNVLPRAYRADAGKVGWQVWETVGAYFRGQLLVALVDAVFIGIGLWILGVPLAVPLAVLVFIGGLFPIVGAFASGALAVLVALADSGLTTALVVFGLILLVQQLESNLLAPVVLGRATALPPLAVLISLSIGGFVLGILGAFIAVPVASSIVRVVSYFRQRAGGRSPDEVELMPTH